ncbi:MAG: class I SAM-dependent methyltransferase, partial [Cellvibrionaceae bacterium]|nr:class I SAM-dependent methyltransferase [Cellvibrionaceae bacterium]
DLLLCLNAPELGEAFIADTMAEACPECVKIARLEPSADFPDRNPDQQLKLFHYRYEGAGALPSERQ